MLGAAGSSQHEDTEESLESILGQGIKNYGLRGME